MSKTIRIGLAGNPNSGKTTLFNCLTGARQKVGNYPGVTVEKKEGVYKRDGQTIHVTDLPGTYSLTAYSIEEIVARDFIVSGSTDVVVDVLDASNIERNLYLAVQLMELKVPLVLALNMADIAKARGIEYDLELLSELFGVPIVPTVGSKGKGLDELMCAVLDVVNGENIGVSPEVNYGTELEAEMAKVQAMLEKSERDLHQYDRRWLTIKLFENDKDVREKVDIPEILKEVDEGCARIEKLLGEHPEMYIADRRYGFISGACQEAIRSTVEDRHTRSDRIDTVVTNRVLGLPIFLGLMFLTFQFTFTLAEAPMGWVETFFGWLGGTISGFWPLGSESALRSLLVDGIIGGVGGVLIFLPNILLLFLAISILEDSGYMARAAFIVDRLMHKIGLHGKSFIPMLLGFGCSVPAIMATRTLDNRRDRLVTMLVVPLMSCGARLPIYALIIPAFFPKSMHAAMLFSIYCIGIVLAILGAKILRTTLFKGESQPFVMELPPYRIPTLRATITHMLERSWLYCKKAGTIILGISIVLWVLTTYPKKTEFDRDYAPEQQAAEAAFKADVDAMNEQLGMPRNSTLLSQAVFAELDMLAEQQDYYEDEPGFAEAKAKKDAEIAVLKKQNGGAALGRFLNIRDRALRAGSDFDEAVAGLEENSAEYVLEVRKLDDAMADLKSVNEDVFAVVTLYLDEVKPSFDEKMEELEQGRRGEELAYSVTGRIGHMMEPALKPMGFDWRIGTALVGALAAKEVFVAQMGIVFSVGEADEDSDALRTQLNESYSPLVGFCIMLFCLISAPCMATIAVTKRESNSWKWAFFQLGSLSLLAWVLTIIVYQAGNLLGIGV